MNVPCLNRIRKSTTAIRSDLSVHSMFQARLHGIRIYLFDSAYFLHVHQDDMGCYKHRRGNQFPLRVITISRGIYQTGAQWTSRNFGVKAKALSGHGLWRDLGSNAWRSGCLPPQKPASVGFSLCPSETIPFFLVTYRSRTWEVTFVHVTKAAREECAADMRIHTDAGILGEPNANVFVLFDPTNGAYTMTLTLSGG